MSTFGWITIFAISAMVINGAGIWVMYHHREWAQKSKEYFMCFAAGILITSPLIMAFPQAVAKNSNAGLAALSGFIFMFFSNKLIKMRTKESELAFGITAIEGIAIHSFIDGVIYSVTFSAATITGVLAGTGLVAHEFAEGIITFSFLIKGKVAPGKAAAIAFAAASLTTPIGAFVAWPLISRLSESMLGIALGAVAGVLIYISSSHLLPEARINEKHHSFAAFFSGVLFSLLMLLTK